MNSEPKMELVILTKDQLQSILDAHTAKIQAMLDAHLERITPPIVEMDFEEPNMEMEVDTELQFTHELILECAKVDSNNKERKAADRTTTTNRLMCVLDSGIPIQNWEAVLDDLQSEKPKITFEADNLLKVVTMYLNWYGRTRNCQEAFDLAKLYQTGRILLQVLKKMGPVQPNETTVEMLTNLITQLPHWDQLTQVDKYLCFYLQAQCGFRGDLAYLKCTDNGQDGLFYDNGHIICRDFVLKTEGYGYGAVIALPDHITQFMNGFVANRIENGHQYVFFDGEPDKKWSNTWNSRVSSAADAIGHKGIGTRELRHMHAREDFIKNGGKVTAVMRKAMQMGHTPLVNLETYVAN